MWIRVPSLCPEAAADYGAPVRRRLASLLPLLVLPALSLGVIVAACSDDTFGKDSTDVTPLSDATVGDEPGYVTDEAGVVLDCLQPQNGPFPHKTTIADETWTADESPHQIEFDTVINGTVTIDPCATVTIAAGRTVTLGPAAKIVARGEARKPITFNARGGAYAGIRGTGAASLDLAYVVFHGGGDPGPRATDLAGTIELSGDATRPAQPLLAVRNVIIEGSRSSGIVLSNSAGFVASSSALTVTGSAAFPVVIGARAAGTLPNGAYSGNGLDRIALSATGGDEGIREDVTLRAIGVAYQVGTPSTPGTLEVGTGTGTGLATLRIDQGVALAVKKGGVISVDGTPGTAPATGALVAEGGASTPIVFTSAEASPAAGDWRGIWFGQVPAAQNRIDNAEVRFAGGASTVASASCNVVTGQQNDAAIRIFGVPTTQFVTNTKILTSAANGVDRGWTDPADAGADASSTTFLPTNSFTTIARCTQTLPRFADGGCPATPACPVP